MYFAMTGLDIWFHKMIPALLPFMILSDLMIHMNLTEKFAGLFGFLLKPLYHVTQNGCYAIFMGFLCGFPMGAKTINELFKTFKISYEEACFLLIFCNNIGPIYFCSFALPTLHLKVSFRYLFGLYGIPLLYGVIIRKTIYKNKKFSCPQRTNDIDQEKNLKPNVGFMDILNHAIQKNVSNMLSLMGYMVFFNLLNLLPFVAIGKPAIFLSSLFEISGGISLTKNRVSIYSLICLSFGGLSCFSQTYTCLADTKLKDYIGKYILHRTIICGITILYYFLLFLFDLCVLS